MRKIPPLNWLKAFESAARNLSFSLAAKELNVTQSAVSQHIKLLEHYLNTPLFIRNPKKLTLTESGKQYLPLVSHAFLQLESATNDVFGTDKETLRLHCDISFSSLFIVPRLPHFQNKHPDIEIQLQHYVWWQRRIETSLENNPKTGLEIRYGDGNWGAPSIALGVHSAFPVIGKDYPTLPSLTPQTLGRHRLFQLSGTRHNWRLWLLQAGFSPDNEAEINIALHSDSSGVLYDLAVQNQGLSLLASILVDNGLKSGQLVRPFDYALPTQEGFYLIKPEKPTASEALFMDWLLTNVQTTGN